VTRRRRAAAVPGVALLLVGSLAVPAAAAPARQLRARTLVVQVAPAMAGVAFALDGRGFASDARGLASITVTGGGSHRLSVRVPAPQPGLRFEFKRWLGGHGGDEFSRSRTVTLGGLVTRLVAGFDSACQVRWSFADEQDESIPSDRVQSVTLKDDSGGRHRLPGEGFHWLPARRVVRENTGRASARPIAYSVESVMVDGTNAVFRSQQRFQAAPRTKWTISLRFYEMHIGVHDALFGFPVGSVLQIRYPDGRVRRLDLDQRSRARSGRLARGDYQLKVQGPGISWWVPVSLSRTQEVRLVFVSWLDLAVAAVALLMVVVGLPLLGGRLRGRRRRATAVAGTAAEQRDMLEQAGS
jgi:hypothetical protein